MYPSQAVKKLQYICILLPLFLFKATVLDLLGSEINIRDKTTNQNICVQFLYRLSQQLNPKETRVRLKHSYYHNNSDR